MYPVPTMEKFPLKGANNLSTSSTVVGSHPLSGDHPTYQAVGRNKVSNCFCTAADRRADSAFYHYTNEDAPRAVVVLAPRPASRDLSLSGQTCRVG